MKTVVHVEPPFAGIGAYSRAIIFAGVAGGLLDILGAAIVYGPILKRTTSALQVFQSVATGLLGVEAYKGGLATASLGLCLHILISVAAAGCYVVASIAFPILLKRPLVFGHAFGVAVYFFMTLLVVPLSAAPPRPFPQVDQLIIAMALNVFLFGAPIAIVASHQIRRAVP